MAAKVASPLYLDFYSSYSFKILLLLRIKLDKILQA